MENLEQIKELWKNQGASQIQFTQSDIHGMVQKKSSSIVKWILIISVLEFLLPNIVLLFSDLKSTRQLYSEYGMDHMMLIYMIVHVIVIVGFIYVFYKNYRSISVGSSVKELLSNILKTRRTVKYYIYYNLGMMAVIGLHVFYVVFTSQIFMQQVPKDTNMIMIWSVAIGLFSLVLLIFWCFYRLLYGFFLRKLNQNYRNLKENDR